MKYNKIDKDMVFKKIIENNTDLININSLMVLLNTSRYQIKKYIKKLRNENLIELAITTVENNNIIIPYWGYRVTDNGKKTDVYKKIKKDI